MDKDNRVKKTAIKETIVVLYNLESPARVDAFLIKKFSEYSRSYFQKLIKRGFIVVNGKPVNKSYKLEQGDEITVQFPVLEQAYIEPQRVDFDVLDIQKDFLIINKPSGLVVHQTKEQQEKATLVSGLMYKFAEFKDFDDSERPGIVHRLDKDTSGILVVARNAKAQIVLSRLFKDRLVKKVYLAVVKGHPDKKGTISLPIGRHPTQRTKMSHVSYAGRPAVTHYKVLQYYKDCSLVEIELETGRTHQIRVHFAAIGHGLLGDEKYGVKSKLIKRQALHSWKLGFEYKRHDFSYVCPEPEDFKSMLSRLELFRLKESIES